MTALARFKSLTLSTRLVLSMVGLVMLTATIISVFGYRSIETVVLPQALERIGAHVSLLVNEVKSYLRGVHSDVRTFRAAVANEALVVVRSYGTDDAERRRRLAARFAAEMASKPEYLRLRLIATDSDGREVVRVDRSGVDGAIRIVPEDQLQRRKDADQLAAAMRLAADQLFTSPISLDTEEGTMETPHIPVLRFSMLLYADDSPTFGILIVDINLRPLFSRIRGEMRTDRDIFLINEHGDYLLHPQEARELGFEGERSMRAQQDFPVLAATLAGNGLLLQMTNDASGERLGIATLPIVLPSGPRLWMIETVPHEEIMGPIVAMQIASIIAALGAALGAIALAVLIARSLTRPLVQMTAAVEAIGRDGSFAAPISASGEIGALARAFTRMVKDIQEKTIALRREMEEHHRIFDNSLDLLLVVDRQGIILRVSPSSMAILGYQPSEMVGERADKFIYPDDLEETRNQMRAARRGRLIRNFETRYHHKDGRFVRLAWTGVWSEPEQRHFFIGRDTTVEEVARNMFQLAVELPAGMIMRDSSGKIILVNSAIERMFGYERDELIGQSIDMLMPERMRDEYRNYRKELADDPERWGSSAHLDLAGRRKDLSEFSTEVSLNHIRTSDGILTLSVIIDVSERRRIERLKDEFVSTVSHELRTPMTSISGALGLLIGNGAGKLPELATRLLAIAHGNCQRLVRLINDILDVEKIEAGQVVFSLKRVEAQSLVEQAIEANRGFAERYDVSVRLVPSATCCAVRADEDRLVQIVTNLLSNAVKFSPVNSEVIVAIEALDEMVRISVRDYGEGIPPDFRAHIFQKFAQADATDTRQKGGTGLGLSIAKQLAIRLGGEVGFDDAPGGGTIFYIELPTWDSIVKKTLDLDDTTSQSPRVLLCEEGLETAITLRERLRKIGCATDFARTAEDALTRAAERRYAAIIVDLELPDADGMQLLLRLREQVTGNNSLILAISVDPEGARRDPRSQLINVIDWFAKPVDIDRLAKFLHGPIVSDAAGRPLILHVDDDSQILRVVAQALGSSADLVSVDSLTAARSAIRAHEFDLAILDVALGAESGLDLLADLRDGDDKIVPVVIFSTHGEDQPCDGQIQAALSKPRVSIKSLVDAVNDRLIRQPKSAVSK